jgi:transcriptional regulator with XRE-family HTH domain
MRYRHAHNRRTGAPVVRIGFRAMDANAADPPKPPRYHDPTTQTQRDDIARDVRDARRAAGLTQPEVAATTGIPVRIISRIENGHRVEPRGREAVQAYLTPQLDHDTPATPHTRPSLDLTAVPSVALLAELGRRLGAQEQPIRGRHTGPPVRVRWKTADGPTQSQSADQPRSVQHHTEGE